MLYLFIFSIVLPLGIFAVAWNQCFWTNFLNCLLIVLSSALAFNYAQGLANLINEKAPDWSGFTEYLLIWLLFIIIFAISKGVCNYLSKYPVRFGKKFDQAFDIGGCVLFTIVMYGWICFTFFASPVGEEGFNNMMKSGPPSMAGQSYGQVVFGLPSKLGMGGQPFDMGQYAMTRLGRAADEANHAE